MELIPAKQRIIKTIKKLITGIALLDRVRYGRGLWKKYARIHDASKWQFWGNGFRKMYIERTGGTKAEQFARLLTSVEIMPVDSIFFYSIDFFKTYEVQNPVFDNYSIDYSVVVNSALNRKMCDDNSEKSTFIKSEQVVINALYAYLQRCKITKGIIDKYRDSMLAIESLFERPAKTFFEGLQRILFINQFLYQTRHTNLGLGRLDQILIHLYSNDIANGTITELEADKLIKEFFLVLHENYWFKSQILLGDTGQIIVLGGLDESGNYNCNELTNKFIETAKFLKLPEPKVLLRCSSKMPDELLQLSLECISTGIGAPLLSNDDVVIPALVDFGYEKADAYQYVTSACWEPLIPGISCDQNNVHSINFAQPLVKFVNSEEFCRIQSADEFLSGYERELEKYLTEIMNIFSKLEFEEDPLLSLLSAPCWETGRDIVRGGAKYCNVGFTSVGMGCVVNSILNISKLVFEQKKYSLQFLTELRQRNYEGGDSILEELKELNPMYGFDDETIVALTRRLLRFTGTILSKGKTRWGGKFKFGLSSPGYISNAKDIEATFDGRQNGAPFNVHISSTQPLAPTSLLSFASKLDYRNNMVNGNVVDFIVTPNSLKRDMSKYILLLKGAFKTGVYQLQINVVDSKTLIAAKENPEQFPNLIVRVWGFSAYFNDLPNEYKDLLIERAIKSEIAA